MALICVSLTGCGTDYKQLGYDTMKRIFAGEAGGFTEEIKDDISLIIILMKDGAKDYLCDYMSSIMN